MKIEVNVDSSKLDRMLADVPPALARAQHQSLMDIGAAVASRATTAFRHPQMRPSPWALRKSGGDWPLLIKSGSLRQSIGWKIQGSDTVVVGTDKKYASYHQFGTKHMLARPFMPVDKNGDLVPQMRRKITGLVEKALSDELRKIGIR